MAQAALTQTESLTQIMNRQVANFTVLFTKLHQYHWLVSGERFFDLHVKFEELYDEAAEHIDSIAERLLSIGAKPVSTLRECLQLASVTEGAGTEASQDMVKAIEQDFRLIAGELKNGIAAAAEAGDDPTADLLTTVRSSLEKHAWMLQAFTQAGR